ncbi:hypothetical protein [Massilia sp. CT11-137]|uniref:hypothetical protein n=1 Tax=Massilia sp. CT11-137 TaxID=3393901 RepID=UPI0039A6D34F
MARIQVGHGGRQEHSFLCVNCKEPIRLAMDVDNENVTTSVHLLSNCTPGAGENPTPVYLSSDFVADENKINDPFYFGSFDFFNSVAASGQIKNMLSPVDGETKSIPEAWGKLQKIWRLENSKQYKISTPLNIAFAKEFNIEAAGLRDNLWAFLNSTFKLDKPLIDELREIALGNQPEFLRFLNFYQMELRPNHRRSQFDIISDYFDNYKAYSQVFPYVRTGMPLPPSARATSTNFVSIKSFYAKVYEFYAGAICIYTCLNNIKEGRPFDELKKITLRDYLATDKAKRRISFSSNEVFSDASSEFDSKLRNASYHNWFFLRDDNKTIEFRSGGTGALETISYTEYLYRCVVMLSQFWKLFAFELIMDGMACEMALVTRLPSNG